MKRAFAIGAAALALAAAGALAALVPAGSAQQPQPPTTTETTATETQTVTATETTPPEPATTTTTTTTPAPRPRPKPKPRPVALPDGVTIGGIHVGGLSPDAAYQVVLAGFRSPLVLKLGAHKVEISPISLGVTAYAKVAVAHARSAKPGTAVPLGVNVHGGSVRKLVDSLSAKFGHEPVDSQLLLRNLKPFVTKGEPGKALDQKPAVLAILSALRQNVRTGVVLPYKDVPQTVSRANFGPVIVVHRGTNRLYLYKGMKPWRVFSVATGQAIYPTPLGKFKIVVKWKDPWWYPPDSPWAKGEKPIPPGPGNPLGTRWMGISAPGVGIHGTPDPASLGYSASHGCIRMYIPYAEWLFDHVDVGTPVYIVPA